MRFAALALTSSISVLALLAACETTPGAADSPSAGVPGGWEGGPIAGQNGPFPEHAETGPLDGVFEQAPEPGVAPPPPLGPTSVTFGPAQCVLNQFSLAQGWDYPRHPRFFADVDADGKDDIVGFADDGVYVARSNGLRFNEPSLWIADFGFASGWRRGLHERTLADVNGDGRAHIVGFGNEGVYVALSSGSSFGPTQRWADDFGVNQGWHKQGEIYNPEVISNDSTAQVGRHHVRMTADINGDGRADIIGFGDSATWFALSTGSSFGETQQAVADLGSDQGWRVYEDTFDAISDQRPRLSNHIRTMADVNGDRRADIVAFGDAAVYVSVSQGASFGLLTPALTVFDGDDGFRGEHLRALGDFDADGRADIVAIERSGGGAAFGTAEGGLALAPFFLVSGMGTDQGWRRPGAPRLLADLNGDEHSDLVGFGQGGVWTAISLGRGPMTTPVLSIADAFVGDAEWFSPDLDGARRFTPDLNGDGRADIAGFGNSCVWSALSPTADITAPIGDLELGVAQH
jgi:hypothetical protein